MAVPEGAAFFFATQLGLITIGQEYRLKPPAQLGRGKAWQLINGRHLAS
jgi:hypothetical protein